MAMKNDDNNAVDADAASNTWEANWKEGGTASLARKEWCFSRATCFVINRAIIHYIM